MGDPWDRGAAGMLLGDVHEALGGVFQTGLYGYHSARHDCEHGAAGARDEDAAARHGLCHLDGHRRGGLGRGRHPDFQGARHRRAHPLRLAHRRRPRGSEAHGRGMNKTAAFAFARAAVWHVSVTR